MVNFTLYVLYISQYKKYNVQSWNHYALKFIKYFPKINQTFSKYKHLFEI